MPDLYNMSDVFISYSRKDETFVRRIFSDLKARGKEVWADFEDIPKAADWWEEIQAGINAADTFIFVISPDSVQSAVCHQEVEHAMAMNKRFIPVLYREVLDPTDQTKVPNVVSSHNWIFFRDEDDYDTAFKTLIDSVETDLSHNRVLTRLLVRAKEWEDNNHSWSYILRGEDLDSAEDWLAQSVDKEPRPTPLHIEYINESRQSQVSRQRRLLGVVSVGLIVAIALAILAVFQTIQATEFRQDAEEARDVAELARDEAESQRQRAQGLALAASSQETLANNDPDLALILALDALTLSDANNEAEPQPQVMNALADAAYAAGTRLELSTGTTVVMSLDYLPDYDVIAAGFDDGRVCFRDGESGIELSCLHATDEERAHTSNIIALNFAGDGSRLLTAGRDNVLRVWDSNYDTDGFGTLRYALALTDDISDAVLADDGNFALIGFVDGRIGAWTLSGDNDLRYFETAHASAVQGLSMNHEGTQALSGSAAGEVAQWDIETGTPLFINRGMHADEVMTTAISPHGHVGISGDRDSGLVLWDLDTQQLLRTLQGHNEAITDITFSADGHSIFTSSWDNSIHEWDVRSGRSIKTFYGHSGGINTLAVSSDASNLASGSYDTTLRFWRVDSFIQEMQMLTNETGINGADYTGTHIVTAQESGDVLLFDALSGTELALFTAPDGAKNVQTEAVAFTLDGEQFIAAYDNLRLILRNLDGETVWDIAIDHENPQVEAVTFTPDGDTVLLVVEDALLLFNRADGSAMGRVPFNPQRSPRFLSATYHSNGEWLMIGQNYFTNNLHLINAQTGEIIQQFDGHSDGVLSIAFSTGGSQVATGAFDNDVRVWDVASGDLTHVFVGHSDRVVSVSFSPVENKVLSASNDRTVRLWDINSGFEVYTYRGHTERVTDVVFSPNGATLLTSSQDSTLVIWRLPHELEVLIDWLPMSRYIRELTCIERQLYVDPLIMCNEE